MPWKDVRPMDEKVLFIADHLRSQASFSELCDRYGISRKTGYKWVQRYQESGMEGLGERSRRPLNTHETPYAVREAILALRAGSRDAPGPKKLQVLLAGRVDPEEIPSKTTIYNILKQAGQVEPRRRKRRVQASRSGLRPAQEPNELWSADYKGQFKTGDGQWCYPLTVMDHASRYLLICKGLKATRFSDAQRLFTRLFQEYGLPERIRTDNGAPFASTGAGGLSRLSVWWIRLGIHPERIEPGQPQQNGRHERMHRTLKRAIQASPARDLRRQQGVFDDFLVDYNERRPHEGLQQKAPQSCYRPSTREYPRVLPHPEYPRHFDSKRVCQSGLIYWRGKRVYVGYLLAGNWVGLEQVGDGLWDVCFGPVRLGRIDESKGIGPLKDYLNCYPCL